MDEMLFQADNMDGLKELSLVSSSAFSAIEINAGVYNGTDFIFGGYANADGSFGSEATLDSSGIQHGSEFMIDSLSFQLSFLGIPPTPGDFA